MRMRPEYDDIRESEYATAVAASAFAIHSLEEQQKDLRIGSGNPLSRVKTRKDQQLGQTVPPCKIMSHYSRATFL